MLNDTIIPSQCSSHSHSHSHSHDSHDHGHGHGHEDTHAHSRSHSPPHTNGHPRSHSHSRAHNGYAPPSALAITHSKYIAPVTPSRLALDPNICSSASDKTTSPADFVAPLAIIASFVSAELSKPTPNLFNRGDIGISESNPLDTPPAILHPFSSVFTSLSSASALAAGSLLLFGGYGKAKQLLSDGGVEGGGRGGMFYPKKRGELVSALNVAEKAASLAAPYFAVLEMGAVRTALVVMGASAGGLVMAGRNGGWRNLARSKRGVLGALAAAFFWDLYRSNYSDNGSLPYLLAYTFLISSILFLRSPYPLPPSPSVPTLVSTKPTSQPSFPKLSRNPSTIVTSTLSAISGPLSPYQSKLSLISGGVLMALPLISWAVNAGSPKDASKHLNVYGNHWVFWWFCSAITGGGALAFGRGVREVGLGAGVIAAVFSGWGSGLLEGWVSPLIDAGLGVGIWAAIQLDKGYHKHRHDHHHHDHSHEHKNGHAHPKEMKGPSGITKTLLKMTEGIPLIHSILIEKDSRRIGYFMCLNFAFMIIQTCYGFMTGSLGLISDSVHMFFDCLALAVGLCAAVMSKWPPSMRYPYGLGKMDTLAGFANGIFLMLISVEIIWEAIERLQAPTEMSRLGELMAVSSMGLAINLVGIMAFDHAHHGHGHSHGHSHGHNPAHEESYDHAHGHDEHRHSHDGEPGARCQNGHAHAHNSENMHGIFLHILADTLGSVSVVISTGLIYYSGWTGFDPLASVFIAVLIFASAIPLVKSSASNLLLTVPGNSEYALREIIAGVGGLKGVQGYTVPRFWEVEGAIRGAVHVQVTRGTDSDDVRRRVEEWIEGGLGNAAEVVAVVESREGSNNCWCVKGQ